MAAFVVGALVANFLMLCFICYDTSSIRAELRKRDR